MYVPGSSMRSAPQRGLARIGVDVEVDLVHHEVVLQVRRRERDRDVLAGSHRDLVRIEVGAVACRSIWRASAVTGLSPCSISWPPLAVANAYPPHPQMRRLSVFRSLRTRCGRDLVIRVAGAQ